MSQVAIKLVIDVVGALESGSMIGNIFALDTNRRGGSQGSGRPRGSAETARSGAATVLPGTILSEVKSTILPFI